MSPLGPFYGSVEWPRMAPVIDWPPQKIYISKGIVILCHKFHRPPHPLQRVEVAVSTTATADVVKGAMTWAEAGIEGGPGNVSTIYSHTTHWTMCTSWTQRCVGKKQEWIQLWSRKHLNSNYRIKRIIVNLSWFHNECETVCVNCLTIGE